jgi:hypothetical protein
MLEKYGFYALMAAGFLIAVAYVWLLIRAFRQHWAWGLTCLLFPPVLLLFMDRHWNRAHAPVWLFFCGLLVAAVPLGVSIYEQYFPDLSPREKQVDGETHLTLTGSNQKDYSTLSTKKYLSVLQMANPDVTDQTLEYLKGMDQLKELDLNSTQVTDEGLIILAELPSLESLRLARTKITDEGFKKHLASKESLKKLDLTGTEVKSKTIRDWKKAKPDRDYLD